MSCIDIFDMKQVEAGEMRQVEVGETGGPVGPASREEAREEARGRYPDVVRMAAGLAANPEWYRAAIAVPARPLVTLLASDALAAVIACEEVCGIGGDV